SATPSPANPVIAAGRPAMASTIEAIGPFTARPAPVLQSTSVATNSSPSARHARRDGHVIDANASATSARRSVGPGPSAPSGQPQRVAYREPAGAGDQMGDDVSDGPALTQCRMIPVGLGQLVQRRQEVVALIDDAVEVVDPWTVHDTPSAPRRDPAGCDRPFR